MSHLGILDIKVKIIRKGISSSTSGGSGGGTGGGEDVASTTAVLGAAKLGEMKLGVT